MSRNFGAFLASYRDVIIEAINVQKLLEIEILQCEY